MPPEVIQGCDGERDVCLRRRSEVGIHTDVDVTLVELEPTAAATLQLPGLLDLSHSQYPNVELPRTYLPTRGHGKLHVIDLQASDPNTHRMGPSGSLHGFSIRLRSRTASRFSGVVSAIKTWK